MSADVTVVDFRQPDTELADALDATLSATGVAIAVHHGIPPKQIDDVMSSTRVFFGMPYTDKAAVRWPGKGRWRGYFPVNGGDGELVERLEYGRRDIELKGDSPGWPAKPSGLLSSWIEYYHSLEGLVSRFFRVISRLPFLCEDFLTSWIDGHESNLSANYYLSSAGVADLPGMKAHTDFGGVTILAADGSWPRLQICHDSKWQTVEFDRYSLLIQAGDLLSALTSNRWKASLHRVIYPAETRHAITELRRISLAYFHIPQATSLVPLAVGVQPNMNVEQYIQHRMESY
jgi:isopenicillin N synthase-like dioxygenase